MRIAILHYTTPATVGGVEAVIAAHIRLFLADGHTVRVIGGRDEGRAVYEGGAATSSRVETCVEPLFDSKHPRLVALTRDLDRGNVPDDFHEYVTDIAAALPPLLDDCDVLIAHNVLTLHKNLPLVAALHRYAASPDAPRFVVWAHDLAWTNPLYLPALYERPPWTLLKTSIDGATYVAISDQRQSEIVQTLGLLPAAVPVVPNGVDYAGFLGISDLTLEILSAAGLDDAVLVRTAGWLFLYPTRLTRRKNVEQAIRIIGALREQGYPALLIVTGPPGPHNPRSDEYVRELFDVRGRLGLEESVVFLMETWADATGVPLPVPHTAVVELYRVADALLFPSTQEGFGIPALEAGLARTPLFCSDIPALRGIAGDAATYFAPDADAASVAESIVARLQADPAWRLRRTVLQHYLWQSLYAERIAPLLG